jgi:hypothetical protein
MKVGYLEACDKGAWVWSMFFAGMNSINGRKRICLLFLLFSVISASLGAELVQVGEGDLINENLPWEPARIYSYTQQVYLSPEIGISGYVNSLAFQYTVSSNIFLPCNQNIRIWMGNTPRGQLENWVPLDSLELVYDGTLSQTDFSGGLPGQGWLNIDLDAPFLYDSEYNLLIAVDENTPDYSSTADDFYCSADTANRGIVFMDQNVNPDPADPPDSGFYLRQAFANLRLDITVYSLTPYQPLPPDQATGVDLDTVLQWQSDADSFDIYLGTSPSDLNLMSAGLTQTEWNLPEPLQMLQTHFWQVVAHHEDEEYPGPVWSFTTRGEGISPPQDLSAYFSNDHVQLNWEAPLEGNPVQYRIFRDGTFFATSQDLDYQDPEVSPGEVHYYFVKAENALGEISGPSNTVSVHIPEDIPNLILQQGFEDCAPFSQNIPGWQNLDLDESPTWGWSNTDFPGEGDPLAWLAFFPAQTSPPLTSVTPHTGAATLVSISATSPPSDDWLISPLLNLGTLPQLAFWARSHTADYGLERLKVLLSTTDPDPAYFTPLHVGNWLEVPTDWTEYAYDLSTWAGQSVYLAWNAVSWDAFALYLDDMVITGEGGYVPLSEELAPSPGLRIYPNPSRGEFAIANSSKEKFDLAIFDLRGRKLFKARDLENFKSSGHSLDLPSGVYFLRLETSGKCQTSRLAIIK